MRPAYFLLVSLPALAQSPSDWPTYNRDLASSRFSPLTQITPANVSKLTQAWSAVALPNDGSAVFARLWSNIGGAWLYNDYTARRGLKEAWNKRASR